jgi:hypothetical protein
MKIQIAIELNTLDWRSDETENTQFLKCSYSYEDREFRLLALMKSDEDREYRERHSGNRRLIQGVLHCMH